MAEAEQGGGNDSTWVCTAGVSPGQDSVRVWVCRQGSHDESVRAVPGEEARPEGDDRGCIDLGRGVGEVAARHQSLGLLVDESLPFLVLVLETCLDPAALVEQPVEDRAVGVGLGLGQLGVDLAEALLGAQDRGLGAAQAGALATGLFGALRCAFAARLGRAGAAGRRARARRRRLSRAPLEADLRRRRSRRPRSQ